MYLSDSCKASASQEGTLVLCPPGGSWLSVRVQDSEEERRDSTTGWERGGKKTKTGGTGFQPLQALGPLLTEPLSRTIANPLQSPEYNL